MSCFVLTLKAEKNVPSTWTKILFGFFVVNLMVGAQLTQLCISKG